MKIEQFEDKYLSHFSYAILSECERKVILIDPARNPEPYYEYAKQNQAEIIAVVETHSHADFVSSHLEIQQATGAAIYVSSRMPAAFPFTPFDDGDILEAGKIRMRALYTPGHSNDSISIVLEHEGREKAVFTGDTLFINDAGRPDLRETQKDAAAQREDLARKMYHSLRDKLMVLDDDVVVYPAHGAGTLCGKSLSSAKSSTIGNEKLGNWALQPLSEEEFVKELISNQPFIPSYFPHDVQTNLRGAKAFSESVSNVRISEKVPDNPDKIWVVDTRAEAAYKKGHLASSVNIMEGEKFETWLGSIIRPDEIFFLASGDKEQLDRMIRRAAAIGYESQILAAFIIKEGPLENEKLDVEQFRNNKEAYTIVDVRNPSEVLEKKLFPDSIAVPLPELRNRVNEIPLDKPLVVHCAAGYRSAAGSSLLASLLEKKAPVFDLGESIKDFQ